MSLPERWTDCYQGDDKVHALGMGVAIGSKLYSKFKSKDCEPTSLFGVNTSTFSPAQRPKSFTYVLVEALGSAMAPLFYGVGRMPLG